MEQRSARELWDAANQGLELIDWNAHRDPAGDVVEGFALAGRWTATVAGAKVGKSILLISTSVEVSEGRDPWSGDEREPLDVVYVDSEMGRVDLEERLGDCGYDPCRLKRWHACEIPPRLDTLEGGAKVMTTVAEVAARLVVIDGLNGTVSGAEKDDTPWRNLYEFTIRPLKAAGVAVVSADNHGKDETLGPRGSSVKLDKADAIIRISRVEGGVALRATHRRTADYSDHTVLDVIGLGTTEPVRYRIHGGRGWPDGTGRVAALLDELEVPLDLGRPSVREMLRGLAESAFDPDRYRCRNDALAAAIRWRRQENLRFEPAGDSLAKPLVDGRGSAENTELPLSAADNDPSSDLPGRTARADSADSAPESRGPGGGVVRKDTPGPDHDFRPDPGVFG
jgi:hypothetical protein